MLYILWVCACTLCVAAVISSTWNPSPNTLARAQILFNNSFTLQRLILDTTIFCITYSQKYFVLALEGRALRRYFFNAIVFPHDPCKDPFTFECQFHATTAAILAQAYSGLHSLQAYIYAIVLRVCACSLCVALLFFWCQPLPPPPIQGPIRIWVPVSRYKGRNFGAGIFRLTFNIGPFYTVERLRLQPMHCALISLVSISSHKTLARNHLHFNASFTLQRSQFWRRHIQAHTEYRPTR